MTSILSSISGYFSKSLILGTFLPVVIFIILSWLFLVPFFPDGLSVFTPLEGLDKEWKVVAVSFVSIVISGLIYNLNIPILRLYEGYPWKDSWIGRLLIRHHQARFDAAQYRNEAMRVVLRLREATGNNLSAHRGFVREVIAKWKTLDSPLSSNPNLREHPWLKVMATSPKTDPLGELREQWQLIDDDLYNRFGARLVQIKHTYPDKRGLILPTRLGNVIRCFEYYSDREYGIDSIELWPRLVAVIPVEYAVSIDDAKTTFDFMMNCSVLSLILAFATLLSGLVYPTPLAATAALLYWALKIAVLGLLSYFFYRLSINRADAWGSLVKGSFDLYRWELLKKLGHKQEPTTRQDERRLWSSISRQMIYGDPFDNRLQVYSESEHSYPSVGISPSGDKLEITRGLKTRSGTDAVTVYLRVRNTDPQVDMTEVVVTDKLPDDLDYEWGSAKIDDVDVPVSGTNPYQFKIGSLLSTQEVILCYGAIPRRKSRRNFDFAVRERVVEARHRAESNTESENQLEVSMMADTYQPNDLPDEALKHLIGLLSQAVTSEQPAPPAMPQSGNASKRETDEEGLSHLTSSSRDTLDSGGGKASSEPKESDGSDDGAIEHTVTVELTRETALALNALVFKTGLAPPNLGENVGREEEQATFRFVLKRQTALDLLSALTINLGSVSGGVPKFLKQGKGGGIEQGGDRTIGPGRYLDSSDTT